MFPDQRYSCTYQAIVQYEGANEIARVTQTGFALSRADCIGAGEPDKSGVRFTRFRCKVFVVWHPPSFGGRPRTIRADGRIAVWPTGRASLSWKLI